MSLIGLSKKTKKKIGDSLTDPLKKNSLIGLTSSSCLLMASYSNDREKRKPNCEIPPKFSTLQAWFGLLYSRNRGQTGVTYTTKMLPIANDASTTMHN
jgi:hypothetical protein